MITMTFLMMMLTMITMTVKMMMVIMMKEYDDDDDDDEDDFIFAAAFLLWCRPQYLREPLLYIQVPPTSPQLRGLFLRMIMIVRENLLNQERIF